MSTFVKLMNETAKRLYPSKNEVEKIQKSVNKLKTLTWDKLKKSPYPKPINEFKKVKGVLMVKIKDHPLSKIKTDNWISVRRAVEILYNGTLSRRSIREGIMRGTQGLIAPIKL